MTRMFVEFIRPATKKLPASGAGTNLKVRGQGASIRNFYWSCPSTFWL